MIFSDFYKGPRSPLSKLRAHPPQLPAQAPTESPDWVSDEYADLLSKDKLKQKDAVKKYLDDKVRNDWSFNWPPQNNRQVSAVKSPDDSRNADKHDLAVKELGAQQPDRQDSSCEGEKQSSLDAGYKAEEGTELDESISDVDDNEGESSADDASSVYSIVSQDNRHYRPRMEWTSDLSDDDDDDDDDNTDNNGMVKKARRRRMLREEMGWNDGLACFEARRNAWTGARIVRLRTKATAASAASPRSPRRFFFRRSMSGSPPNQVPAIAQIADMSGATSDSSSVAKDSSDKDLKKVQTADSSVSESLPPHMYPVETMLPIGQPLLPPNNPLRASIAPPVYLSLYDKVIMQSLQPACPINLSDMLRSCVAGWKRDGEWPPRPMLAEPSARARKKKRTASSAGDSGSVARRMSFGLLGRDKDDEPGTGKGIRRSLQRALGMGAPET